MFSEFLLEVITSGAVSAVLTGLLLWLTKSWVAERLKNSIKNEYDHKLATHKSELKARTDADIETHKAQLNSQVEVEVVKLKSSLSVAAAERHIKFSNLHEVRARVIAHTYSLLKEVYVTVQDYVKPFEPADGKSREERREIARNAHKVFREYYPPKIIFLPQPTAKKVEAIDRDLVVTFMEFANTIDSQEGSGNTEKWIEIDTKMKREMKETLEELENEFRKLLGDES
ncbi:MAG: hypothetical protein P9M15_04100 [Candidatus Electryoneaceae bacterium]|nr:hypothetical protein [Candidatus Electryoneaceae bacterium]